MKKMLAQANQIFNDVEERMREAEAERNRATDFSDRYGTINQLPILRTVIKWMYVEGWGYSSALLIITLLGFVFRIWNVSQPDLWIDEVLSATAIKAILAKGLPTLPSGVSYFRDVLYHYICALSSFVLGLTDFSMRLPSVFFGTLTIPLSYCLGKHIKNKEVAIAVALCVAFNSMEIAFSRQVRYYQAFQFFFGLSLLLFSRFALQPTFNARLLIYGVVALCLCLLTTFSSILLVPVIILGIAVIDYHKLFSIFVLLRKRFFISLLLAACLVLFFITNDFFQALTIINKTYSNLAKDYIALYLQYLPLTFVLSMVGMVIFVKTRNIMFLLSMIAYCLVAFFLWNAVWYRFLHHLTLFLIIGSIYLIFFISRLVGSRQNVWYGAGIAAYLLTLSTVSSEITLLPRTVYRSNDPHTNYRRAYNEIKNDLNTGDAVVSITTGIVPAYYYLGEKFIKEKNYCLTYKITEQAKFYRAYSKNGLWYEDYTGSRIITDFRQLFDVLKHNQRGWIIWDQQKLYHIDQDTLRLLEALRYLEEASDETIKVYCWDFEHVREMHDGAVREENGLAAPVKLSGKTIFQVHHVQIDQESGSLCATVLMKYDDARSEDTTYYILKPQLAATTKTFILQGQVLPLPGSASGCRIYQSTYTMPLSDSLPKGTYRFDADIVKETVGSPPEILRAVLNNAPLFIIYRGGTGHYLNVLQTIRASTTPVLFDEAGAVVRVIAPLEGLKVGLLKDIPRAGKGRDALTLLDIVLADNAVNERERLLLNDYVESGGIVIEGSNRPPEDHVWELRKGVKP